MRTNSDPEGDDSLLDAVLGDQTWQAASAAFKAQALGTFRARQRVRRVTRWAGSVVALVAAIVGAVHWFRPPGAAPQQPMLTRAEVPKVGNKPRELTDEELIAAFPKGTCFIAEIDGKKELVFFDPEVERRYVAEPGVRAQ